MKSWKYSQFAKEVMVEVISHFMVSSPQFSQWAKNKSHTKLAGNLSCQSLAVYSNRPQPKRHMGLAPCRCVVPLWVWLFVDLSIACTFFSIIKNGPHLGKEMDHSIRMNQLVQWRVGGKIRWLRVSKVRQKNMQTCKVKWATFETPYAKTGWLKRDPFILAYFII